MSVVQGAAQRSEIVTFAIVQATRHITPSSGSIALRKIGILLHSEDFVKRKSSDQSSKANSWSEQQ